MGNKSTMKHEIEVTRIQIIEQTKAQMKEAKEEIMKEINQNH